MVLSRRLPLFAGAKHPEVSLPEIQSWRHCGPRRVDVGMFAGRARDGGCLHRDDVTVRAKAADYRSDDRRNFGMPMLFIAAVDVRNVELDDRPFEDLQRVDDRNRSEGIGRRIDNGNQPT